MENAEDEQFEIAGSLEGAGTLRAALVFAQDAEGRVLLQLRDNRPGLRGAGSWCIFGGQIEPGESIRDAARREFEEETGIALRPAELAPAVRMLGAAPVFPQLYILRATRPVRPQSIRLGEGAGFGFFEPDQIAGLPLFSPAERIIAICLEKVRQVPSS